MRKAPDAVMADNTHSTPIPIAFLVDQFLPLQGGSEVATLREAEALSARGHAVHVLTLRLRRSWARAETLSSVPVRRIGGLFVRGKLRTRFGARWLSEALLVLELLRTRQAYALIHLRHLGVVTRPGLFVALMTGKPLLARISGCGPEVPVVRGEPLRLYAGNLDPQSPFLATQDVARNGDIDDLSHSHWLGALTLRLLKRPNVTFVAVSTRIRADLLRRGFSPGQIRVLPTGIDSEAYQMTAQSVRERSKRAAAAPVVVCVAHLRYEKGQDILLHAWRTVHAQFPAARLVLAGRGPLEPQLRAMCAALGISEQVEFAGMIPDVRSILSGADMFVLPSRHEGLPNALLEAMASSLPCVATRVSGSEDVIVDGASGLLVPPEDPSALVSALTALLSDQTRARTIGEAGRQRIRQAFSMQQAAERLEELYVTVTCKQHARRQLSSAESATQTPSDDKRPATIQDVDAFIRRGTNRQTMRRE